MHSSNGIFFNKATKKMMVKKKITGIVVVASAKLL